jgi:hypothetical protein
VPQPATPSAKPAIAVLLPSRMARVYPLARARNQPAGTGAPGPACARTSRASSVSPQCEHT